MREGAGREKTRKGKLKWLKGMNVTEGTGQWVGKTNKSILKLYLSFYYLSSLSLYLGGSYPLQLIEKISRV